MNPIRGFDPSRFTRPVAPPSASETRAPAPARASGATGAPVHPHDIPSQIVRGGRPPIKVGSFKLPKGISKNRAAQWLKPIGEVTELEADDARASPDDDSRRYSYRARDRAEEGDIPDREIEIIVDVHSNGQLKQLRALASPGSGLETGQSHFAEINFDYLQSSRKTLGGLAQKLQQQTASKRMATDHDKTVTDKLAEHIKAIEGIVEEQAKRNEKLLELANGINL
jgi:hypothetical protein